MIEIIVIRYLEKKLDVDVFFEEPLNKEDEYVTIEKTGGYIENYINHATIVVQSYAKSLYQAALLNEKVKKAMFDIVEIDDISSVKLNSDYNFTDQSKKKYRYQSVFEFIY